MDSALISVLTNLGTGGVVIVLMILGYLIPKPTHEKALEDSARKDEVIEKLTEALALERQRSNDASQAGQVTNQLLGAFITVATGHAPEHRDPGQVTAREASSALDLTGKDLGL